jgi:hypothetical protein
MMGICATLVAKSTKGNHFIFLSEMAQVILYGRRSTKHCLLSKQKSFSGAEIKIHVFCQKIKGFPTHLKKMRDIRESLYFFVRGGRSFILWRATHRSCIACRKKKFLKR